MGWRESYIRFAEKKEQTPKRVHWEFGVWQTKNAPIWNADGEADKWMTNQDGPYSFHGECHGGVDNPPIWYEFNWNMPGEEG